LGKQFYIVTPDQYKHYYNNTAFICTNDIHNDYHVASDLPIDKINKAFRQSAPNFWCQQIKDELFTITDADPLKPDDLTTMTTKLTAKNKLLSHEINYQYYNLAMINKHMIKTKREPPKINAHTTYGQAGYPFKTLVKKYPVTVKWEDPDCKEWNIKEVMVLDEKQTIRTQKFLLEDWYLWFGDYSYSAQTVKYLKTGLSCNSVYSSIKKGFLTKVVLP
jgi:hypothetical protein